MKTFDVEFIEQFPAMEIEAINENEAKRLYLEAVIKAIKAEHLRAIELDIID